MYQHNQTRPGQGWAGGGRQQQQQHQQQQQQQHQQQQQQQQQEVRILSSTGFGVSRGGGQQGGGGMFRSSQQGSIPSQISAAQARGMSGHYQGNVMIAGQGGRNVGQGMVASGGVRSGSVGSAGQAYGAGLQGIPGSRSQSLSSSYAGHGQRYTQQQRETYQTIALPSHRQSVPGHQQFIPGHYPVPGHQAVQSNFQQRPGQVYSSNSTLGHQQQVSSSYRQVQAISSYPPQLAAPATPANTTASNTAEAAPENPFLSAFEKSFESFLNSKYSDDVEESTLAKPDAKPDPNSVENISSILNDFSKSDLSAFPSNPLNVSSISRHPTIPRTNVYSQPKPLYNPIQQAKIPSMTKPVTAVPKPMAAVPKSMTGAPKSMTGAPKSMTAVPKSMTAVPKSMIAVPQPMTFVQKPMTFVQSKPVQSIYNILQTNSMVTSYPQPNTMNNQVKSLSMPAKNSPSNQATKGLPSYQSPQGRILPSSTMSQAKVISNIETVILDDPEDKPVAAESKPAVVKTDPDRRFQCNSCPKAFKSNGHLKEHEMTHTGNYPFNCDTCKKGFKRENTLNSHKCLVKEEKVRPIKEEKVRPFKCDDCSKGYASKKTLHEHKCASTEGNVVRKLEKYEEEEPFGDIVESVEVEVPVVVKSSDIVFTNIYGIAMIIGDLIEYQDFNTNLEDAALEGWEVEVIGDENMIWDEKSIVAVDDSNSILDGIEEIAKGAGLTADDVRDTLKFFCQDPDENLEDQSSHRLFPWQNILSVYEEKEKSKMETKSKEELLLGDEKNSSVSDTLEELDMRVGKDALELKAANNSKAISLNKFTYFNDKLETTIEGGSGEDSDDEWTLSKNKCNLCKKKFSSKWHLKKHAQIHTGNKGTYKCIPCKKSFKRKDLREKHRCEAILSESVDKSYNSTINEDVEMSSDDETLDEKADVTMENTPKRQSMLLHSTLM